MSAGNSKADTLSASVASVTTAAAPVLPIQITGLPASQSVDQGSSLRPFAAVTITDPNPGQNEVVTVLFNNPGGNSSYNLTGSPGGVTTAIRSIVFRPTAAGNGSTTILPPNATYTSTALYEEIDLGGGSSTVTLQAGGALVMGDAGNDYIIDNAASGQTVTINVSVNATDGASATGSAAGTILTTNSFGSTIVLGTGNTTVNVLGGGPIVYGSSASGSLFFSGGAQSATVDAGIGATTVFANAGGGQFYGGQASSMLFVGGGGASTAVGGAGRNVMFGGSSGRDLLVAGTGASTVVGSGDGIVIVGLGSAGDVLVAGSGAETLVGSAGGGNDILFGGTGPDAMFAGDRKRHPGGRDGRQPDVFQHQPGRGGGRVYLLQRRGGQCLRALEFQAGAGSRGLVRIRGQRRGERPVDRRGGIRLHDHHAAGQLADHVRQHRQSDLHRLLLGPAARGAKPARTLRAGSPPRCCDRIHRSGASRAAPDTATRTRHPFQRDHRPASACH